MKTNKMILSLILSLCLLAACFTGPVYAALTVSSKTYSGAGGVCNAAFLTKSTGLSVYAKQLAAFKSRSLPAAAFLGFAEADLDADGQEELVAIAMEKQDSYSSVKLYCADFTGADQVRVSTISLPQVLCSQYLSSTVDAYVTGNKIYIAGTYASGIMGAGSSNGQYIALCEYTGSAWNCVSCYQYGISSGTEIFNNLVTDQSYNSRSSSYETVAAMQQQAENAVSAYAAKATENNRFLKTVWMVTNSSGDCTFTVTAGTDAEIGYASVAPSKGDINGDGRITASDARLALRRAVGLETYANGSAKFNACDMNGDGKVTAADARLILRAAVGLR